MNGTPGCLALTTRTYMYVYIHVHVCLRRGSRVDPGGTPTRTGHTMCVCCARFVVTKSASANDIKAVSRTLCLCTVYPDAVS